MTAPGTNHPLQSYGRTVVAQDATVVQLTSVGDFEIMTGPAESDVRREFMGSLFEGFFTDFAGVGDATANVAGDLILVDALGNEINAGPFASVPNGTAEFQFGVGAPQPVYFLPPGWRILARVTAFVSGTVHFLTSFRDVRVAQPNMLLLTTAFQDLFVQPRESTSAPAEYRSEFLTWGNLAFYNFSTGGPEIEVQLTTKEGLVLLIKTAGDLITLASSVSGLFFSLTGQWFPTLREGDSLQVRQPVANGDGLPTYISLPYMDSNPAPQLPGQGGAY